jgi:hypothetical protein
MRRARILAIRALFKTTCISDPRECAATGKDECRSVGASWRHGARQRGEEARYAWTNLGTTRDDARFLGIGEGMKRQR